MASRAIGTAAALALVASCALACARPAPVRAPEIAVVAALPPLVEVETSSARCGMGRPPASSLVAMHGCESIPTFAVVGTESGALAFGVRGRGAAQEVVAELLDAGGHSILAPKLLSTAPGAVISVAASARGDDAWVAWSWLDPRLGPVVRLDALALGSNGMERGHVVLATRGAPIDLRIAALSDGRVAVVGHDETTPCGRRCAHVFEVQLAAADGAVSSLGRLVVHGASADVEDIVDLGDAVAIAVRASDDDDDETRTRSAGAVFRYGAWAADRRFVASCDGRRELFAEDGALLTYCHADTCKDGPCATLTTSRRMDAAKATVKRARPRCVDGRPRMVLSLDDRADRAHRSAVLPLRGAWTGTALLDASGFELRARGCSDDGDVVELR